ncbi:hypothetical protein D3C73_1505460 [compost metagenome]
MLQARENVVLESDMLFKQIIGIARGCSHPYWSVQHDIAHPFDAPIETWPILERQIAAIGDDDITESFKTLLSQMMDVNIKEMQ